MGNDGVWPSDSLQRDEAIHALREHKPDSRMCLTHASAAINRGEDEFPAIFHLYNILRMSKELVYILYITLHSVTALYQTSLSTYIRSTTLKHT